MRVPSLLASVSTATSCCCGRERIARSLHKELTRGRCVNRRRHFDRAVTHLLAGGTGRAAYSAYRHQQCCKAAKLQLGPRLLKRVRWNTNTRCGRVLTALKAAAATRVHATLAPRSQRGASMQAAAPPPASVPASPKKQRRAARDERTSIGNLSEC